ncbi:hypothetical protein LEC97_24245, partial [Salmonella enterica]|nr:hypothetical protein [Salmonella enterica]
AQPHPTTNEPTATMNEPSRRAQTIIFNITHHRWRAMLSPPRLPTLWGGFNAVASGVPSHASTGAVRQNQMYNTNANVCISRQDVELLVTTFVVKA